MGPLSTSRHDDVRGNVVTVRTDLIRENLRALQATARTASGVIAVIKANAYGIGADIVARALVDEPSVQFAVVTVEEASALRSIGVQQPILVLGGATWLSSPDVLFALNLTPLVSSVDELQRLSIVARDRGAHLDVHLAVDTGMGREGARLDDNEGDDDSAFASLVRASATETRVRATGLMTHFANADLAEHDVTRSQVRAFSIALERALGAALPLTDAHVANTACALTKGARPDELSSSSFDDLRFHIRPGIGLLGVTPFPDGRAQETLHVAFQWDAPVVMRKRVPAGAPISYGGTCVTSRDSEIAVLGVGYADGYPRALSNRGVVRFGHYNAHVLGRVCMDLTIVDVTDVVAAGDERMVTLGSRARLLGGTDAAAVDVWPVAALADTIAYELTNRISHRVARVSS